MKRGRGLCYDSHLNKSIYSLFNTWCSVALTQYILPCSSSNCQAYFKLSALLLYENTYIDKQLKYRCSSRFKVCNK